MLHWLAQAARKARETAGRKQVHVAASADKDQSSIYRFEQGEGWPRDTDLIVAAYADDLDCDPIEIWEQAISMWREAGEQARVAELQERRTAKALKRRETELDTDLGDAAQQGRGRPPASRRTSHGRRKGA